MLNRNSYWEKSFDPDCVKYISVIKLYMVYFETILLSNIKQSNAYWFRFVDNILCFLPLINCIFLCMWSREGQEARGKYICSYFYFYSNYQVNVKRSVFIFMVLRVRNITDPKFLDHDIVFKNGYKLLLSYLYFESYFTAMNILRY